MRAATFVGRVGGLAVALGIGVAATGVASAESTGPEDESKTTSVSAPDTTDTTDKTDKTEAGTAAQPSTPSLKKSPRPGADLGRAIRRFVEKGVAVSNGGAFSRVKAPKKVETPPTAKPIEPDESVESVEFAAEDQREVVPTRASKRHAMVATKPARRLDLSSLREAVTKAPAPPAPARIAEAVAKTVPVKLADRVEANVTTLTQNAVATATRAASMSVTAADPVQKLIAEPPASVPRLVRSFLSGLGFGSLATDNPLIPSASPLLALVALGSRRELEERVSTLNQTTASTSITPIASGARTAAPLAAAAVTAPVTTRVGWLTGANSINDTVNRFGIYGTDVGVMWDNGVTGDNPNTAIVEQREVLIAFGDTFSGPGNAGWRMNTLFRSPDRVLSDGLYIPDGIIHDPGAYSGSPMTYQNYSREIIGNYHYGIGSEVTMIPTAAISVQGAGAGGATRQYVQFMAVRSWDSPGRWTTNYSAIAYSDDNGQNWTVVPASSVRAAAAGRTTTPYVKGNENFQMGAFVKPPAGSPEAAAGWVYSYGTPAGRGGTVYLSRVNQANILDQTKYEYWNGSTWVKNQPSAAKPILPGTTKTSFFGLIKTTTYPTAGEMSVQYNTYLKKYVMLYTDQNNNVVMRTSSTPQGTWSAPKTVVTSAEYPGLYAPMIHPWSGTTQLKKADGTPEDPQYLYWGLSQWNEYNVALMKTDLSRV